MGTWELGLGTWELSLVTPTNVGYPYSGGMEWHQSYNYNLGGIFTCLRTSEALYTWPVCVNWSSSPAAWVSCRLVAKSGLEAAKIRDKTKVRAVTREAAILTLCCGVCYDAFTKIWWPLLLFEKYNLGLILKVQ